MNFEHFLLAICAPRSSRRTIMVLYINQFVFGNWQLQCATCNLQLANFHRHDGVSVVIAVAANFCAFHLSFISILSVNFFLLLFINLVSTLPTRGFFIFFVVVATLCRSTLHSKHRILLNTSTNANDVALNALSPVCRAPSCCWNDCYNNIISVS